MASEVVLDQHGGISGSVELVLNSSPVDLPHVRDALIAQGDKKIADALGQWINKVAPPTMRRRSRFGGILDRDKFLSPTTYFDKVRLAREALKDDVVGGAADGTEAMAIDHVGIECDDPYEEDVWNQIAGDLDLDGAFRKQWRALFTDSSATAAVWWGEKTYKPRLKTETGRAARKEFKLQVPIGITFFDTTKIVPVGSLMFGQERMAYAAEPLEAAVLDMIIARRDGITEPIPRRTETTARRPRTSTASGTGNAVTIAPLNTLALTEADLHDPIVERLILGRYTPSLFEQQELLNDGIEDINNLYLLDFTSVSRHTLTRLDYERFPECRLESIFGLLDLKSQLQQMDRVHLVGGPLRVDQRIATPGGWMPIGSAKIGDKVMGVDGKPTTILGVMPQGVLPMYRVTFTDGAEVYCDPTHPWTVQDRKGRERTLRLEQILAEGLFEKNSSDGSKRVHRHRIPVAQPLDLPEVNLPVDPYLLGYLLGDGSIQGGTPRITTADTDDTPWVECLPEGVTVRRYDYKNKSAPSYSLNGSRWHHNELTQALISVGMWGLTDHDKFIPDDYLWASAAQRWSLLQGLLDSDGYCHTSAGCAEYATVSEKLAEAVVQLAQSLGGVARTTVKVPTGKGRRTCYSVFISLQQTEAPFRLTRKIAAWRPRRHQIVRAIASAERVDDAPAVCIKTAREDGLFLTEGMVVTHNSHMIILITKGTDDHPAQPEEISALRASATTIASVPLIVGDHRLHVEIITPKLDITLDRDKWDTLDVRIFARAWGTFIPTGDDLGDPTKIGQVIGHNLGSRRKMMRRYWEKNLLQAIRDRNPEAFTERAKVVFQPTNIAFNFDAAFASFMLDLRQGGDIAHGTVLTQFGMSIADEARKVAREKEAYGRMFQENAPFNAFGQQAGGQGGDGDGADPANPDDPNAPKPPTDLARKAGGRQAGGRRNGGGAAPGTGQGKEPVGRSRSGGGRRARTDSQKKKDT